MNDTIEDKYCYNAFTERLVLSFSQSITIGALLSILSPTIATINFILCLALIKTKQIKNHSQRFIMILGISDFCVGAVSVPLLAGVFTAYRSTRSCLYEKVSLFFGHFNTRLTAYVIFLIGIDRYFNITPNIQSKSKFSKKIESKTGYKILIAFVIVICAIQGSITVIDFEERSLPNNLSSAFDSIVYLTYLLIYIRLYYKIRKFSRNNSLHAGDNGNGARPRYIKNLVKTVLYLLVTVGLCYLPYVLVKFIIMYKMYRLNQTISRNWRFIHYLSFQPIIANSFFNTIIILNRNSVLKKYIMKNFLRYRPDLETVAVEESSLRRNSMAFTDRRIFAEGVTSQINGRKQSGLNDANNQEKHGAKKSRVRFSFQNNNVVFAGEESNIPEVDETAPSPKQM